VRLQGPDGKPLADIEIGLSYSDGRQIFSRKVYTDERGEHIVRHTAGAKQLSISMGNHTHTVKPQKAAVIKLSRHQMNDLVPARRLQITVVAPDGRPAVGWYIAEKLEAWGAGGMIGGPYDTYYRTKALTRLGAGGQAQLARAGEHIGIVSPEGVPFIYPVTPRCWPKGLRKVTVRIPPVRKTIKGTAQLEDGKPLPDLSIGVSRINFGKSYWLKVGGGWGKTGTPLWAAKASDGKPLVPFKTDKTGRYELPVYFGAHPAYRVHPPAGLEVGHISLDPMTVLKPPSGRLPQTVKRIELKLKDEKGRVLPEPTVSSWQAFGGGKRFDPMSVGGLTDSRGCRIFVDARAERLQVKASARGWSEFDRVIEIKGARDRTLELTLSESLRQKPVSGRLVDADGRPASGVSVSLYTKDPSIRRRFWGLSTTTDEKGSFRFPHAPDRCFVSMYRYSADGNTSTLPGWVDKAPGFTRDQRNLTIRLRRAGSVKVLLPKGPAIPAKKLYITDRDRAKKADGDLAAFHLRYVPKDHCLRAPYVRPGTYELASYLRATGFDLSGLRGISVTVKTGRESVIDLSTAKHYPPKALPHAWVSLSSRAKGKPVSGALVQVFTDAGGGTGQCAPPVLADLSDESGGSRFRAVPGRRYVAVARVHGRLIGWKAFKASPDTPITINMVRARTILMVIDNKDAPKGWARNVRPQIHLHPRSKMASDEASALLQHAGWGTRPKDGFMWVQLKREKHLTYVAEDLPVNIKYVVELGSGGKKTEFLLEAEGPVVRLLHMKP